MSLLAKNNPIGIDAVIDGIQKKLFTKLTTKWSVDVDVYPRCYVIDRDNVKVIEHYKGKNEYYGNLIVAEKNKIFFIAENDHSKSDQLRYQTNISAFCIFKVDEIYPSISHRCDNEVMSDVMNVLATCHGLIVKRSIIVDFKKVFQGYRSDMDHNLQPYFCFRVDMTLRPYKIDQQLC